MLMINFFSTTGFAGKLPLKALAIVFSAALAFGANAQDVSLQQAIQMGLQNSKQLQITQAKEEQAEAKYKETFDLAYPLVNLTAGYSRLSDVPPYLVQFPGEPAPHALFPVYLNSYQSRLSANELLFAGFRVRYAKSSAEYLKQAASLDVDKDKDLVVFNIVSAYYNIYKLMQGVVVINQNLELIKERIKDLQAGEREGITLHNDVVRAQLQESNFKLAAIDATNGLKTAQYNFNLLIGITPPETDTRIDTSGIFPLPALNPLDEYMQVASVTRSDLQSLNTRNLAAQNNVEVEQKDLWPNVTMGGNLYFANPNQRYIPPIDQFKLTWDVGLNLNWNMTNLFTNKHQVDESKAILSQGLSAYDQLSDAVKSEVYSGYLSYNEALEKLNTLKEALGQATENYQLVDSRYKNSVAIFSDLVDAQSSLLLAQINYYIGKADAQVAILQPPQVNRYHSIKIQTGKKMAENKRSRKIILPIILGAIVLGGAGYGINTYVYSWHHEYTDDAQIDGNISPVVSRVTGYVDSVLFEENQLVNKGQLLIMLDDRDLEIKVQQAQASLDNASARCYCGQCKRQHFGSQQQCE
jgi:outer membrane protein TolC